MTNTLTDFTYFLFPSHHDYKQFADFISQDFDTQQAATKRIGIDGDGRTLVKVSHNIETGSDIKEFAQIFRGEIERHDVY